MHSILGQGEECLLFSHADFNYQRVGAGLENLLMVFLTKHVIGEAIIGFWLAVA